MLSLYSFFPFRRTQKANYWLVSFLYILIFLPFKGLEPKNVTSWHHPINGRRVSRQLFCLCVCETKKFPRPVYRKTSMLRYPLGTTKDLCCMLDSWSTILTTACWDLLWHRLMKQHITSLCESSSGTLRSKSRRKSLVQTKTSYLLTYVISQLLGNTDQMKGEQHGQRNIIWRGRETHQCGLISDNCML